MTRSRRRPSPESPSADTVPEPVTSPSQSFRDTESRQPHTMYATERVTDDAVEPLRNMTISSTPPDSCVETVYPGVAPQGHATAPMGAKGVSTTILALTAP